MERTRTHNLAVGSVCKLRAETLPTQPPRHPTATRVTRPGVDPLEVTRPLADVSWTSQSPQATSPSVIARQPTYTSPGPWPPVASHVFGPSTTQVDPDLPDRESRQTTDWHHTQDPGSLHKRGLCRHAVTVCLCVCLPVRHVREFSQNE